MQWITFPSLTVPCRSELCTLSTNTLTSASVLLFSSLTRVHIRSRSPISFAIANATNSSKYNSYSGWVSTIFNFNIRANFMKVLWYCGTTIWYAEATVANADDGVGVGDGDGSTRVWQCGSAHNANNMRLCFSKCNMVFWFSLQTARTSLTHTHTIAWKPVRVFCTHSSWNTLCSMSCACVKKIVSRASLSCSLARALLYCCYWALLMPTSEFIKHDLAVCELVCVRVFVSRIPPVHYVDDNDYYVTSNVSTHNAVAV